MNNLKLIRLADLKEQELRLNDLLVDIKQLITTVEEHHLFWIATRLHAIKQCVKYELKENVRFRK